MPTPSRFTSPTLAPGPKSIGTQRRPRSRGGVGVGRYWGRSPGGPSDDLPLGRRRLGWVSYYRVLPPPAATARLSERVRVCGGGASGSGGSVRATCGTFEPRTFSGDSHTPPRGGGDTSFVFLLLLVPGSLLLPLVARLLPLLLLCSGLLLDLPDRCCEGGGKVVSAIFFYRHFSL